MDNNSNLLLSDFIESQIDDLIQEDDYYQAFATPLKSASIIKQEHKRKLEDFFKFSEQRSRIEHAEKLISDLMPTFVSTIEFAEIKEEFDNSASHFSRFIATKEDEISKRPILLQEMLGLSDETLLHIYSLGRSLFQKNQYEDALALFTFLTILAPHVSSYWIFEGACFQIQSSNEEALAAFNAAKFLNPLDPLPIAYAIESYHALKDKDQMKNEIQELENLVSTLSSIEIGVWRERLNQFKLRAGNL